MEAAPQTSSLTFNEQGEVTQLTVGYVMDKQLGNTGGLGGVFGIFYALGWGASPLARIVPVYPDTPAELYGHFTQSIY